MIRELLLIALLSFATQSLAAAELIIDDFKTGHISQMSIKCGVKDQTLRAGVPGKHRWVRLKVNTEPECQGGNPFNRLVSAKIQSGD